MTCPSCSSTFEPVEFREMGARRWLGKTKEEKLAHARKMLAGKNRGGASASEAVGGIVQRNGQSAIPVVYSDVAGRPLRLGGGSRPAVGEPGPATVLKYECPRHRKYDLGCEFCRMARGE